MANTREANIIEGELARQLIDAWGVRLMRELGGPKAFLDLLEGKHTHVARMNVGNGKECGVRVTIEVSREPFRSH